MERPFYFMHLLYAYIYNLVKHIYMHARIHVLAQDHSFNIWGLSKAILSLNPHVLSSKVHTSIKLVIPY